MMNHEAKTVLIVDDERHLRQSLAEIFEEEGFGVLQAADGEEALRRLQGTDPPPSLIFLDLKMPRMNGLATLKAIAASVAWRQIPVIIITSFGTCDNTIEAMKLGAYNYITKPLDADEIVTAARKALELAAHPRTRQAPAGAEAAMGELLGRSARMREVFKLIGKVAASDATVLITGESGTGKELVARAIHRHSSRANKPLITVSCAALPETLLESELFGHERGAFTGALHQRIGRFELAQGGTIFLDEIGEIPASTQVKLLRVLQDRRFERLGGRQTIEVDYRLLAATNQDLHEMVKVGRFREDLYYRLNVVTIDLPPLRELREDIMELASAFLQRYSREREKTAQAFSEAATQALLTYDYPGNVRELENIVERAVVLACGSLITPEYLPPTVTRRGVPGFLGLDRDLVSLPFETAIGILERELIVRALQRAQGNRSEAARQLGINRQLLYAKIKEHRIEST